MSETQFQTTEEMLNHYYGGDVTKADAPILSSTTGVFNAVYGAQAFAQFATSANALGVLPKYPWQHSGFRVLTADAGSSADGGIAEGAAVPDSIKPTVAEIDVSPKEVAHVFQVSTRHDNLSKAGDDVFGSFEQARPIMAGKHARAINQQLLVDTDTLAGNNFESIDRVTASAAYATALSITATDVDIYGIDRSANSWSDAVCQHNSGTDRNLTLALIEETFAALDENDAETTIILTGKDQKWAIIGLAQTDVRYQGVVEQNVNIQIGINGVETEEGIGFGRRVATVYGIPLIADANVPKDTGSRVYFLDTTVEEGTGIPRLGISLLNPTMYAESRNDPFKTGSFTDKGLFYTSGELVCVALNKQGSLRDLN